MLTYYVKAVIQPVSVNSDNKLYITWSNKHESYYK